MKCPICKTEVAAGEPYSPFCSDRCRINDLGNWAAEKYVIPVPMVPDSEQSAGAGEANHGE